MEEEFLSDTLFSHFENKSKLDSNLQLQLARYNTNGDLEWLKVSQSSDGTIYASYTLNKHYDKFEPNVWNIFNVVRFQGCKRDSLLIENEDKQLIEKSNFRFRKKTLLKKANLALIV